MTDIPDLRTANTFRPRRPSVPDRGYVLEETYWGYRVVPQGSAPLRMVVLQSAAMIGGATFLAVAVTLLAMTEGADLLFRIPVMIVVSAIGSALMWFASRGTLIQIEVDTMNGEVREVVRNRTGAITVLARYGFDSIGSVFITRPEGGKPSLVLRYFNTARTMTVASGQEPEMARLRDRMGRDLIINREVD
ncbi:hypothetical protein ACOI1H_09295 [Loktanella sp. DJP18]|uniref:hypothetical protein n=1 Tax=Loktanella sp. DJP18 TaxID=3409788 RepID=UPI003BB4FB85